MYVIMTLAILLTEYKKLKNLVGYKMPKRKFAQALENDLIYALVVPCKGDKKRLKELFTEIHLERSEQLCCLTNHSLHS